MFLKLYPMKMPTLWAAIELIVVVINDAEVSVDDAEMGLFSHSFFQQNLL